MVERKVHGSNDPIGGSQADLHLRLFRWGFMNVYTVRPSFLSSLALTHLVRHIDAAPLTSRIQTSTLGYWLLE
ncbi:MAG: hypothetical protein NTNFB01_27650 [Nitrospira sp.]